MNKKKRDRKKNLRPLMTAFASRSVIAELVTPVIARLDRAILYTAPTRRLLCQIRLVCSEGAGIFVEPDSVFAEAQHEGIFYGSFSVASCKQAVVACLGCCLCERDSFARCL